MNPRPSANDSCVAANLLVLLGSRFHGKGWEVLHQAEMHVEPMKPIVPDLSAWRDINFKLESDQKYITVRPDWVCEILSPSTQRNDYDLKLPTYERYRVPTVWFVDPMQKLIVTYKLAEHPGAAAYGYRIHTFRGAETVCAAPFTELEFKMSEIFP